VVAGVLVHSGGVQFYLGDYWGHFARHAYHGFCVDLGMGRSTQLSALSSMATGSPYLWPLLT